MASAGKPWDARELAITVADYFSMLKSECQGVAYKKSEHIRLVSDQLASRTDKSVEYKYQNISAVMIAIGLPWINGYEPARNVQKALIGEVVAQVEASQWLHAPTYRKVGKVDQSSVIAAKFDPLPAPDRVPDLSDLLHGLPADIHDRVMRLSKIDWFLQEQAHRETGEAGERYVLEFERQRLQRSHRPDLAEKVEWSSKVCGDGLGYDVLSFDEANGSERWIEVKTTRFGVYTPFFVTANELRVSKESVDRYWLYRVHNLASHTRVCAFPGGLDQSCVMEPRLFRAQLRA